MPASSALKFRPAPRPPCRQVQPGSFSCRAATLEPSITVPATHATRNRSSVSSQQLPPVDLRSGCKDDPTRGWRMVRSSSPGLEERLLNQILRRLPQASEREQIAVDAWV